MGDEASDRSEWKRLTGNSDPIIATKRGEGERSYRKSVNLPPGSLDTPGYAPEIQ